MDQTKKSNKLLNLEEDASLPLHRKVAIVGIGCRYANGINNVTDFVRMLREGFDCTTEPPEGRYDTKHLFRPTKSAGKMYNRRGGYLRDNIEAFDRQFFKMPPEEANTLDPQVRLLLETTWEGLEDAGIPASIMKGSNTGVYMGVTANEYNVLSTYPYENISQYTNSGTNSCMVANRISYELDLRGPSFSVDTACSSSLYTIHLACEAIRTGACDAAVAGGVNLLMSPVTHIGFCQAGMLAPDGRCKSFDNAADGYSRSEGAGVVILKPLEKAIEDGDDIYAVIRGGALSNDGHTPGIANPSYEAQVDLVYRACKHSNANPHMIEYIEAHGTGTKVGDKTEANALGEALGKGRKMDSDPALYIGSVKSNVGHTEGAAGVAGIIKVAVMQRYNFIPPVVHFKKGNENIAFDELNLKVPTRVVEWPRPQPGTKRLSGCSSFGFGGANAHMIVEEPPSLPKKTTNTSEQKTILHMSAASSEVLEVRKRQFSTFLENIEKEKSASFASLTASSYSRSHHHRRRLAIVAQTIAEAKSKLNDVIEGKKVEGVVEGNASERSSLSRIAFVFTGMGSQWWAMGRQLYEQNEIFRRSIESFDAVIRGQGAEWTMTELLTKTDDQNKINNTAYAQPAICALEMGLVQVLQKYGIKPDAIVGHSVGEVPAAYASGMMSFEDAVKVIYHRGEQLCKTSGNGKMLAVLHPCDDVISKLNSSGLKDKVDVAAINSPTQVVLSGESSAVDKFAEVMKAEGIRAVMLKVNNAFHSYQQEVLKDSLMEKFSFLKPNGKNDDDCTPMVSSVTGDFVTAAQLNSKEYWWNNVRQKVSFKPAIEKLLKNGYSTFLEIGAHPALGPAIMDIIRDQAEQPSKVLILGTLKRPRDTNQLADDQTLILAALAKLHCEGYPVNFEPVYPEEFQPVAMPLYPWHRVECSSITKEARDAFLFPHKNHSLLGKKEDASPAKPTNVHIWNSELTIETVPWIMDHVIQDSVIAPGTSYLETALQSARELHGDLPLTVSDVDLKRFLFMPDCRATLQVVVEEGDENTTFSIYSKGGKNTWSKHATGNILPPVIPSEVPTVDFEDMKAKLNGPDAHEPSYLYGKFSSMGYALGSSFQGMKKAWFSEDLTNVYTVVKAADYIIKEKDRYNFHPAMMDALMQGFGDGVVLQQQRQAEELKIKFKAELFVPLRIKKIQLLHPVSDTAYVHSKIYQVNGEHYADINVADDTGKVVFRMEGVVFGKASDSEDGSDLQLWTFNWDTIELPPAVEEESSSVAEGSRNSADILVICEDENTGRFVKQQIQNGMQVAVDTMKKEDALLMENYPNVKHVVFAALATELPIGDTLCEKQAFVDMVQDTCIAASNLGQQISDMPRPVKPKLWIVTRGAHIIGSDLTGNPLAHSTQAVAVGLMNEVPDVHTMMIDLPVEKDMYEKCLPALKQLLMAPPETDNELCLRSSDTDGIQLYGRRLRHRAPSSISHPVHYTKWGLKEDSKSKSMFVIPASTTGPSPSANQVLVQVKSFKMLLKSSVPGFTAIVAGSIMEGERDGKTIVGFTSSPIQASMFLDTQYMGQVPHDMQPTAAVGYVDTYLIPFVVAQTLGSNNAAVVVYGKSATDATAFQQILSSAECKVNVFSEPSGVSSENDAIVLLVDDKTNSLDVKQMLKSVKPFGKVVTIIENESVSNEVTKVLSQVRFASCVQMSRAIGEEDPVGQQLSSLIPAMLSKVNHLEGVKIQDSKISCLADTANKIDSHDIIAIDTREVAANLEVKANTFKANQNATYLITGASKGFGLEVLQWLHTSGARHIVVFSRSQPQGEDKIRLGQMEEDGVNITWKAVNITDSKQVEKAVSEVQESHPPIEGIIHCAAVYRDGWMKGLKDNDWHDVMLPKAYGAYILHQVSVQKNLPLKHFVMFSSVVNLIGSAGQSNYCAANGFLYSLGEMRRSMGLPSTVASFGVINTVGFAARNDLVETWEDKGLGSVSPSVALNTLGMMLNLDIFHLGITGPFEQKMYYPHARPQLNEHLLHQDGRYSRWKHVFTNVLLQQNKKGMGQEIMDETPATAKDIIRKELASFLCERLGIADQDSITLDNPPTAYGLDSLLSSDMSNHISEKFQIAVLPVELLNDKNTIGKLVSSIYEKIMSKVGATSEDGQNKGDQAASFLGSEEQIENPSAILVCFPPNGGGMSTYNGWQKRLKAKNVQVYVAQLPGWEGREQEKPLGNFSEIVSKLAEAILPVIKGKKFTFYGHSFGCLLAYEVSHSLKSMHGLCPDNLYLAAWYGPTLPYVRPDGATKEMFDPNTPIEEAIKQARCFRFLDEEVLNNVHLMKRMLPCINVSLDICEQYKHRHSEPLPASLYIYSGTKDAFLPEVAILEWEKVHHPNHKFQYKAFEGAKHLFLLDPTYQEKIVADILVDLNL